MMFELIHDGLVVVTLIFLIPALLFVLELLLGILPFKANAFSVVDTSCVILIPAHNEESVLPGTLKSLMPTLSPQDRVLVVADNCDDQTAEIAKSYGCDVLIRQNDQQRGKGFALASGISHLNASPPETVIILDADCDVMPDTIQQLKAASVYYSAPVQGAYLMYTKTPQQLMSRVSAFAVYIKNHIRLLGLSRLGASVPITGSGVAVPYKSLCEMPLASGEIVEDMKLGLDFALHDIRIFYWPLANIRSPLPLADHVSDTQRTRWEHGHVVMIKRYFSKLLSYSIRVRKLKFLLMALDLAILPVSLLLGVHLALLFAAAFLGGVWGDYTISGMIITVLILEVLAIFLVNSKNTPYRLSMREFSALPGYLLKKVTIYERLLGGKKSGWDKTDRDS